MIDYSQGGETQFVLDYFATHRPAHRFVVDAGAYGREFSNSHGLLQTGWQGLLIEANPDRIPIIEEGFKGLEYALVNCAVGGADMERVLPLHLCNYPASSSFLLKWSDNGMGRTGESVDVITHPFSYVLREYHVMLDFDVLFIDIEGMDEQAVANMIHNGWRPQLIVTEVAGYGRTLATADVDCEAFYERILYKRLARFEAGNPWGNMIFERVSL